MLGASGSCWCWRRSSADRLVRRFGDAGACVHLSGMALAIALIVYGFLASALPVWLLLAPRDYLSTFVKLGVIGCWRSGISRLCVRSCNARALTRFCRWHGPVFAGKIFPFCFITIACGAVSGFHALISSGTTPKLIARERHASPVGYGSMLLESFVAIMALIAACSLQPGVYFAVNSPAGIVGSDRRRQPSATITSWGFPGDRRRRCRSLAQRCRRKDAVLAHRRRAVAGAGHGAHFRVGGRRGRCCLAFWYHFAIMFEALFILTIIDAGTRVGRFMLQDLLGHVWTSRWAHQLDAGRDRRERGDRGGAGAIS